jgi:hypothetical protein
MKLDREGRPVFADLMVRAQPGASRERIVGMLEGALKVAVTAPPEKGKANEAIEQLLAAEFGLPRGNVRVVTGATARLKRVRIIGVDASWVKDRLDRFFRPKIGG